MRAALALMTALCLPTTALAGNLDRCEIVVVNEVIDEFGGSMTVASYRPADPFLAGVYDPDVPLITKDEGHAIRGVICVRNDLVPTDQDYPLLATGIPLSLSQDFDSGDSDILTIYFADGAFQHKYTSDYPMSREFKDALEGMLQTFSAKDHGLVNASEN